MMRTAFVAGCQQVRLVQLQPHSLVAACAHGRRVRQRQGQRQRQRAARPRGRVPPRAGLQQRDGRQRAQRAAQRPLPAAGLPAAAVGPWCSGHANARSCSLRVEQRGCGGRTPRQPGRARWPADLFWRAPRGAAKLADAGSPRLAMSAG
jgi:hypothetical protein